MKGGWENQHKLQESTSASFLNGCLVLSFSVQLCIFRQGHSKLPYHWMRGFPLVLFVYLVFFSQDLLIREKKHNFLCFCVSSSWTLHSWYTLWVSLSLLYAYVSVSPHTCLTVPSDLNHPCSAHTDVDMHCHAILWCTITLAFLFTHQLIYWTEYISFIMFVPFFLSVL